MTEREIPDESYAGGLVSLQMAEAHLNVHLTQIDSVDSKAMFLVGLNAAVVSAFVAILAASSQPLESVIVPGFVALIAGAIGAVNLWPREVAQFPAPEELQIFRAAGHANDTLAWAFLDTLQEATAQAAAVLRTKARLTLALLLVSFVHVTAVVGTAILLLR